MPRLDPRPSYTLRSLTKLALDLWLHRQPNLWDRCRTSHHAMNDAGMRATSQYARDVAMLDRVDADVVDVAGEIGFIADGMFRDSAAAKCRAHALRYAARRWRSFRDRRSVEARQRQHRPDERCFHRRRAPRSPKFSTTFRRIVRAAMASSRSAAARPSPTRMVRPISRNARRSSSICSVNRISAAPPNCYP